MAMANRFNLFSMRLGFLLVLIGFIAVGFSFPAKIIRKLSRRGKVITVDCSEKSFYPMAKIMGY